MLMAADIVADICPALELEQIEEWLPILHEVMEKYEINTTYRRAAFLAQLAHESGGFKYFEEIWGPTTAQRRYEPQFRKGRRLGNKYPGDGKRFKGRGPIQITGRANYTKYGLLLGLDLVHHPELAATPKVGFEIAGLYWKLNGLNDLADKQYFKTITKRINGGYNGYKDRLKYYGRALKSLLLAEEKQNERDAEARSQIASNVPDGNRTDSNVSTEGPGVSASNDKDGVGGTGDSSPDTGSVQRPGDSL